MVHAAVKLLAASLSLLVLVLAYNTITFTSLQPRVAFEKNHDHSFTSLSAEHLAERLGKVSGLLVRRW